MRQLSPCINFKGMGFRWRDQFITDAVLPMGCSSSRAIFECYSTALGWASQVKSNRSGPCHYELLLMAHSFEICNNDSHSFITMRDDSGVLRKKNV